MHVYHDTKNENDRQHSSGNRWVQMEVEGAVKGVCHLLGPISAAYYCFRAQKVRLTCGHWPPSYRLVSRTALRDYFAITFKSPVCFLSFALETLLGNGSH